MLLELLSLSIISISSPIFIILNQHSVHAHRQTNQLIPTGHFITHGACHRQGSLQLSNPWVLCPYKSFYNIVLGNTNLWRNLSVYLLPTEYFRIRRFLRRSLADLPRRGLWPEAGYLGDPDPNCGFLLRRWRDLVLLRLALEGGASY